MPRDLRSTPQDGSLGCCGGLAMVFETESNGTWEAEAPAIHVAKSHSAIGAIAVGPAPLEPPTACANVPESDECFK